MLTRFNIPGQTGKPYTVKATLDGQVIAQGESPMNAFTHITYKACYDAIPAEYEPRIDEILMVDEFGGEVSLSGWIKQNGY